MPEPVAPQVLPAPAVTPSPEPTSKEPPKVEPKADVKPESKTSIYADVGLDEPGTKGSATWPENWREQFAGEDKDAQTRLARYGTPKDVAKALIAAQQKISSGEYKRVAPPPDGATEEVLSKWREDNGLPTKADAYEILPQGVVIDNLDESGKATLAKFQNGFLKGNLSQGQAKEVSNVIYEMAQTQMAERAQADAGAMDKVEDTLRAEWGPEYRSNIMMNKAHLDKTFGDEMSSKLLTARLEDGTRLADLPEFNKAINSWARSEGGDMIYDGGGSAAATVDSRIAEIEKVMSTDLNKYDKTMADEYGKLLAKRESRGGK